ncbi:MAG: hypothetical protein CL794_03565, partial [Chloroflexi bacterium]|nr:hypothetical protein [Chloroflexota bacterium]
MDKVLLKCRGISKRFSEVIAITGLDLDLNHGEIVSILGSSGCGKTTLLRLIAGLEKPDEGSIELEHKRLFGKDINVPPNKRGLGMVFQEYALFPHLSVRENILFGISTLSKKDQETKLKKVLDLTRIGKLISRFPSELSGGEQQRVALARTLATEPSLLLM